MKRFLALLLTLVLATSLLGGCNSGTVTDGGGSVSNTASGGDSTVPTVKLGIIIWGTTDALGRNSTMMVTKLVEQVGGEVVIDTSYTSPETQIQSAENLIAAGCNAILVVNSSDTMLPKLGQVCEENQVYWGLQWRSVLSAEIQAQLDQYEYFIGNTCEDEVEIATRLAQNLADAGCVEVGVISSAVGDTTHDQRNAGFDAVCAETDLTRVAEHRSSNNTAAIVMEAVEKFITAYPDLDAIFLTGGTNSQLEGALAALDKHNRRGEIKIAVIDFIDADLMEEYLNDGTLFSIAGGHYVDPVFTAAMLVNAVQGNRLSDTNETITLNFIDFQSFDDARNYYQYVENDADGIYAYTEEELGMMLRSINPDLTMDDLRAMAAAYSIEDVMTRHGNN